MVIEPHSGELIMTEEALVTASSHSEIVSPTESASVIEGNSYIPEHPGYTELEYRGSVQIEWEADYSNIVGYAELDEYPADEAVIRYYVKNTNKNTGFWIHTRSFVQCYDGTDWITLPYVGSGGTDLLGWGFHFGTDYDGYAVSEATIDLNEILADELVKGDYRIVCFLADRELYINFKIV